MISLRIALILVSSGSLTPPLLAQTPAAKEDLSDQIITGAWGDPAKCNFGNATPVSFAEAASGDRIRAGTCIVVTAYWKGRAIYANGADANTRKSSIALRLKGRRVGVYAEERMLDLAPHRPKPFRIVGSYAFCATEWPGAMMVLGYCHHSDGPFLKVSQVRAANRSDVR